MNKLANLFIPTENNRQRPYLLSKVSILIYTLILLFVNSFGGLVGISEAQASSITPVNVVNLTNQERISRGLNILQTNPQLSAAALAKANDMFEKQYWDHYGPNGETPWQFIRESGYNYVYAGENLAKGFRTSEGIHEAWMASPTHKANIISGTYKDIGVAVVEGELLGKQTILVVQMFGNLTPEVFGATLTPGDTTETPPIALSAETQVVVRRETGQIKSIRITSPQQGSVVTTSSFPVEGNVDNSTNEYTIELYNGGELLGDTTSTESTWKFQKDSDWSEGDHTIKASLKNGNISSPEVTFTVDSKAPLIDLSTLMVEKTDEYFVLTFKIDGEWKTVHLVIGSKIYDVEYEIVGDLVKILIPRGDVRGTVTVVLSDSYGNTSELDITEYFQEEETKVTRIFPSIVLSSGDTISIGIVLFVFVLLVLEILIYSKNGKLKDALSDIFAIGIWTIVLTIAIFNGFTGVIN